MPLPLMIRYGRAIAAALVAFLAAHAAVAAPSGEHPPLHPEVDATIVYRLTVHTTPPRVTKLRIIYADHSRRVRVDDFASLLKEQPSGSVIFDRERGLVLTLIPDRVGFMVRRIDHLANPGVLLNAHMRFVRGSTETIAGIACTNWHVTSGTFVGTACISADGIVLRAVRTAPRPQTLLAVLVRYGKPPAGTFAVPAGYVHIDRLGHLVP